MLALEFHLSALVSLFLVFNSKYLLSIFNYPKKKQQKFKNGLALCYAYTSKTYILSGIFLFTLIALSIKWLVFGPRETFIEISLGLIFLSLSIYLVNILARMQSRIYFLKEGLVFNYYNSKQTSIFFESIKEIKQKLSPLGKVWILRLKSGKEQFLCHSLLQEVEELITFVNERLKKVNKEE